MISGNYASPQLLRKLFSLMVVLLFTSASFGQVISNTGSLPETCFGDCDGAMWFTITGGTAPYFIEYQSNDNPTVFDTFLVAGTDTTFNLCASSGAYTIIVTDGGGGATGASQTLNGPSRIAYLNLGVDTVSCVDTCDGNINGFAVGGNGSNYDYNWSNSGTTATLSNLCAMNYLVTITDDSGCVGIDSVPVINRDTLRINLSTNDATCRGLNNGNSAANVTGGVLPYTYNWTSFNTGQPSGFNTDSIFNLLADTFPLVVTDGNNCPIYDTAIVDEPTGLDIDTTITQVDCFGNNSGEIHLDVSGGIPGYVYNWDPVGAGTDTAATGLVAGTYMVTITDNNGAGACPEVLTIVITEPDSIEITFNNTNVNCFGDATGQSIALLQGGSAPFSYSWNHTALDNDTVMNLSAGNYGLTVTDDEGCSQNALTTITQNDSLEADLSSTPISCATADDGSISANPQGGIGNYAYSWSSGESTQTINSKGPGTYILTLTDDSGCVRIDSLELIEPQSIQANLNITDVSCFNNQNGSAVASPLGGTRPFSYTWVNITTGTVLIAFTDSFATSLDTGNYSLTIQDDEGCTSFTPFSISQPDSILANATSNDLSCFGDLNGMASSAPTGGTGVYTYEWSSNPAVDTLSSVSGIGAGSYTVTVTDASGCTGTQTVTINQPDSIEIVFATSDASCGLCDGDATATVTGGVLPYASLSWSNGDAGTFADQLCTQFYDITVTDDSGCVRIDSVEILSPGSIILNPSQVNNKCSSDNSGEATVSPTGGLGGYIYAWSNGATDSTITGLDTGTYTVTVSDAQPCILTQTFNITSSPEVIVNITQDSASCSNIQDGGATANVTGGTSPFTYLWSNAQTDASATNLGIGFHYVTVTDDSGCAAIDSLEIQPKITIVSGITIVTEDCNDLLCDGTAMASASGGATPYSFSWSSGVVVYSNFDSSLVDSVCGGQLIVIAQDQDGCEGTDTIIMPVAPTVLQVADSIVDISCNGEDDGEFHALVTGGAPPYSYSWSNGETGTFIDSLAPGSYSVTITDTNNCVVDTSGAFINPSQLIATGSGTNITCNGSGNGTATATVIGGTTPYDYLWPVSAGNQTTATATGLNVGSYVATVTDARGCTDTTLVIISEPNGMQSSGSSNQTTCFQDNDGTASVTITGGTSPYNYQWDINTLNQTGMTATGLSAGTYYVTVSDDNSCTLVDSVEVTEPDQFTGSSSVSNLLCSSDSNGIVVVTIAGGTPNYTYLWDAAANNQTTATATGLAPGTYGLTVTDSRGCDSATSVTVTGPPILLGNVNEYDITCGNGNDGAAAIQPQGGTTPYSILWSTGSTLDSLSGLSQGTYYVTLTDDNNCTVMDSAVISEPLPLAANVNVNASNCNQNDGSVSVGPITGGTPNYTHSWSTGATTSFISGLTGGIIYSDTIRDSRGCILVVDAPVSELGGPQGGTVIGSNTTCFDSCNGTASVVGVFGGVPPYTYSWSPGGQTDTVITGLCADTITLSVTDDSSCTSFFPPLIISSPDSIDFGMVVTATTCDSIDNGALATNVSGGTSPYSYLWSTSETTSSIGNLAGGTYGITVTDANGCVSSTTDNVNESTGLAVIASIGDAGCANNQDGFVGLNPSNGVAPYSFVWDPSANNQTTATATGLGVGTYSVTITDGAGCSTDSMFSISSAPAITITPTVSNATCAQSNGSISVAASGGTGGYSYLWSPTGETTSSITGLSAGLDTVRVSDNSGCFEEFVIAVQSASNLSLVSFGVNPTCNTGINGMAWTTASQGTPPYSYSWSPGGQTTDTISGLGVGDYYIQVTDDSGCVAIDTVSLNGVNAITITFNKTDLTCQGSSNGFALANPVGGVLPYQYSWSNSVTTQSNSPLSAGTYYLTVTDANSCTGIDSVSILEPQAISISFNRTNVDCYGQSSGAATALATGGTGPFDYSWATGDQSPTVGSLDSGYHVITVTDANSCMAVDSVQILSADSISNISSITDATCNNATGAVTVITSGGSGPYTYLWSPSASTSASITGLSAGVYTLTTTDDVGCTKVDFYTVNNSNGPAVNVVSDTTTCFGGNDANLTANVTGGTTPYLYQWNDLSQQTTVTATGLSFGIYQVAVTDDANCVSVAVAEVSQPQQISTSISIVDADCGVTGDVSATITASGGQPNYSFQWPASAGNQTSATATGLTTGTYVVTITDNNLCSKTETVIVDENSDLQVSISGADENCAGSGDGSAFSTVTGGVAPYTYAWSNSGSSVGITNLSGGTYIVTITDDIGCTTVDSIVVNSPNALSSSMSTINPQCFGDLTGEATVTVSGGISPYTYNWSPTGQTTQTAITLFADTHIVQVIDDRGCSIIDTAIITSPTMVDATISTTEPGCQDSSGVITVTPFGGSGSGYTYQWDNNANNQTDSTATGLIAGTYDVTITDGSGCTNTFNITLNNAGAHTVTITTTAETCFGANDGTAAANVLGGTSPYTYSWSNGDTSITADSLPVGPVSVTVIDSAGCIVTANDTIDPGTNLSVSLNVNHISCGGTNDGSIFINASGGFPPYSYSWSPNTTNTTDSAVGLSAGTYFITVSDTSSCAYVDSVEILNPAPYTLGITSKDLDCYDDGSGEITISIVGGGNAPFTYSWSNGATDSALVGLDSGSYSVTVTDASNCVEDTTINLTQPDEIVISFTSNNPTCNDSNGTIFSSVNGGVGPLVYAWGGQAVGQTADSAINLAAGAYPLTVTDSTGCAVIDSFPLSNSNAPVITTDSIVDVTCFGLTDAGIYITATSPSLDTPLTYLWTPTNVITEDLINASAGGHTVFVTDTTGCVGIEFYNLNQPDSFEVTFNSTMPSCNGLCDGQIIAEVNGGTLPYAYSWSPGGQTDSSATGLCAGTHVLMVTDSNNCILQDSTILVEPVAIVINIDTLLEPLCVNSGDGQINVTTSGGAGNLTYSWTGPGAFAATSEDISNLDGGLYSLVVSDTSGCQMNLDTTLGTQIDVKIDSLTISDTLICSGDTVNISGYASGASGLVFDWTLNDTLVSNAQIFSQTPIAGTQVYVFTAALGPCTVTDSVSVEVLPGPIVNAGDDIELLEGLCADIGGNPSVPAGVTFVWSPSTSLSSTTEANPETCTEEPLTYYLTGTDVNGCKTTDSILVSIVPEISFLEGFSPNGDGIRDEWIISNLEDFPDVVVEIFNRWGQKLFESSPGYLDPWDGTYNGKSLPIGTYFYVIELNHPNFPDEINGPVTILK